MLVLSLAFAGGVWLFHQLGALPGPLWLLSLPALLAALRWPRLRLPAALAAGLAWSHLYALATVPAQLADAAPVVDAVVEGRVVSLVDPRRRPTRFVFQIDDSATEAGHGPWRVRLSWHGAPGLVPGERWRLPVRLRHAHGYASPGAWDYEGWLYWQGIRYTGYVRGEAQPLGLDPGCCRLTRWRQSLSDRLDALPASAFARGVMRAITLGDGGGLDSATRDLFRDTGTSHLMAISGLHIGLVAALGLGLLAWLWRHLPGPCARVPARVAGAVFGLTAAIAYAALAGFGLPTQRAMIMLAVAALALIGRRDASPLHALALAMVLVLLWHPPSILAAGFWLSFGAVLVIFAVLRRAHGWPAWRQALAVQLALGIALWPVLGAFGLPAATVAPLVNLLLVPLFGAVVVPASLAVVLLAPLHEGLAGWLGGHLGSLLDLIHAALAQAAAWSWPTLTQPAPGAVGLLVLAAGLGLLLAPPGIPLRGLALPLLLVGLLPREPTVPARAFELHLLDVGQGLASVVLTRHHVMVFDSGPEYPGGFNAAEAVVAPFLRHHGRRRIDRLVISHGDSDHAGGLDHLHRSVAVGQLLSGEVERVGAGAQACVAGTLWDWDGVRFEILHPPADHSLEGNDASCVVRVANAAGSVLLTGDIGRRIERRLVDADAGRLRSDVVVAPHHGSRSSSSAPFVAASAPRHVLYAAGWANRFGFPAAEVAARWDAAGATALNTASAGTISLRFDPARPDAVPRLHRTEQRRFWNHRAGSAATGHAVSSAD